MAGNKINTKSKGREDKGKGSKVGTQSNEDSEDLDFSLLRKPINTSVTGFAQARKIFDLATEELRNLLSNECDILYECKVCRNIFRSLANFISHKRVYCKEKFNSSIHGHFIKSPATINEILQIKSTEEGYQESLKLKSDTNTDDMDEDRIPLTKDLTAVVEKITKTKGICNGNEDLDMVLKKIPSSTVAVFQNVNNKNSDNMRAQVRELDNILSRDKAVLQSDGKFTIESSRDSDKPAPDMDSVIQISDDDENDDRDENNILKCKICDLQFSTLKTLKFHTKYKHLESRLVYPCPDCLEIFSTSWSVYRHLFKVHRKTAAQIRRLRESIQAKAFKMDNPPAFYEKRKNNMKPVTAQKITEEERLDQENQAWMDNMEGDGEVPRCGGCGRTFERRAALAAHTHTCQPRSRALARRPENKKIEIQIRKDYNKGPSGLTILKFNSNENKPPAENTQTTTKQVDENEKKADDEEKDLDEAPMDIGEEDQNSNDSVESQDKSMEIKPALHLPFAMQAEKSNLAAFKQRIQTEIDYSKNLCKKCDSQHASRLELYEHVAGHFKWMRYACKLCNFKHYNFEKLPEHVKVVHKLKGDTDFYFSTVKAIDGTEAMIISRCLVESESTSETNETNETSPDSRRLSRCSSDSSRLSDDSSSSSTLKEFGSRKRKIGQNKTYAKKKKEITSTDDGVDQKDGEMTMDKVLKVILGDKESTSVVKSFEENSSDMEDNIEEKVTKRGMIKDKPSIVSRRPVRKRTKPKNEDFEYDLSNLLKMEAQGYRDSQTVTNSKPTQSKKKVPPEILSNFDALNKDCCGALAILSKKAVETAAAHIKTANFAVYTVHRDQRSSNIFVRPMLPKIISRADKMSPKKDVTEESKDKSSPNKVTKVIIDPTPRPSKDTSVNKHIPEERDKNNGVEDTKNIHKDAIPDKNKNDLPLKDNVTPTKNDNVTPTIKDDNFTPPTKDDNITPPTKDENITPPTKDDNVIPSPRDDASLTQEQKNPDNAIVEKIKPNMAIPAVVPIKFRRQSLEIMKPIINKNITDFTKAGMKTKILVIKPINRNKDGTRAVNSSLKFQTIKLKDPNKGSSSNEDKSSDQVVVVKVPKVDCAISRPLADTCANSEKSTPATTANNVESIKNEIWDKKDNAVAKLDTENKTTTETKLEKNCDTCYNESDTANSGSVTNTVVQQSVTDQTSNAITAETSAQFVNEIPT